MAKIKDPGFGYQSTVTAKRLVNLDGSFNLKHQNKRFSFTEVYSKFIDMPLFNFIIWTFGVYIGLNTVFATLYYAIGIEQLSIEKTTPVQDFLHAYFFSAQTLTTLGYGFISPHGNFAALVSSFEALIGLMGFALLTGLLYGRFSKPSAAIKFSNVLLLRPFKKHSALMFRLINKRSNIMIEPEVSVTLAINEPHAKEQTQRKFFKLKLEREKIMYLPTTWTIVHEIDEKSPLFDYSDEEIQTLNAELLVLMEYYEESFAQQVYQIHSFSFEQIVANKKFEPAFHFDAKGNTVLDHSKLNSITDL